MVGFPALSMERYARELLASLEAIGETDWKFESLICGNAERVAKLLPGTQGEKWASRAGRFIKYPLLAKRAVGNVYHVLDHSHANLAQAVPGEKSVITCHDVTPYLAAIGKIPMAASRWTRYTFPQRVRAMRRCRYIIADSESTKRDLMEHFGVPEEQIVTVHLGKNTTFTPLPPGGTAERDAQSKAIRAKHKISPEAKVVFHVGTPLRYKNTPTLLKAFKLLREEMRGTEVWFLRAGGPFFEDEQELINSLGIADRVVHAGKIPTDEELAAYYRAVDAFGFPSLYEGFGWPPLEAMACGTPCVTSDAASLPEIVGDAGLTVKPTDAEGLASALHRILTDDTLRATLKEKSIAQAATFTWENCARQTLAVYERVAKG